VTCWWWVRHGPTHAKAFVGHSDVAADLSDAALLDRIDAFLPRDALVVSSDLTRAHATADAIGGSRKRLSAVPALRETNFGAWEMQTFADVGRTHPDLSRQYFETPGDVKAPDGESWNDVAARVGAFVDDLNDTRPLNVVAVAHFGVILSQVQRAAGMTPRAALAFNIDNLSITRLDFNAPDWSVRFVNHTM